VSTRVLDHDILANTIWLTSPDSTERLLDTIDDKILAYLGRYCGWQPSELERMPVSRLRKFANSVSSILEAENKG
jgi:hypothetical protein